jgi:hypothetical protein
VSLLTRKHSYDKLADIPFFSGWTHDELAHIDRVAEWVDYQPLEHLIKQGTTGYEFIVILSGEVDVVIDGHVIAELGPGDHVGEMALLDGSPRTASVIAKTAVKALLTGVLETAREIAERSPLAIWGTKVAMNYARDHPVDDALDQIATWQAGMFQPADLMEAFSAKAEKRATSYPDLLPDPTQL